MPFADGPAGALWYLQRGSGIPLVMLHGAGGSGRHWGYQLAALKALAQTLAPDLPAHGRSPGPSLCTIPAAAGRVLQWLDELGLQQVVLMGHSMGGAIAQWLARHAPDRVLGLVLVATGARLPAARSILDGLADDAAATTRRLAQLSYRLAATSPIIDQAVSDLSALSPAVLRCDFVACDTWNAMAGAAQIIVPTLVLVGAQDRLTPLNLSAELHGWIAGSQLAIIPDAGHMVMIEQADAVNRIVATWLTTLKVSAVRYTETGI